MLNVKILVSFCNQANQGNNLLLIDDHHEAGKPLITNPESFTGLTQDAGYIYAASQTIEQFLYIIDKKTYQVILRHHLTNARDVHSLVVIDDNIYLVSTGTDQVLQYRFDRTQKQIQFTGIVWQPTDSHGISDTHHLNALVLYQGELFVSGFGPKTDTTWSSAKHGYVFNITRKKYVLPQIYHPHSLTIVNNEFYYCESSTRSVKKNNRTLVRLKQGYVRGLSVINDYLIFGTSSGRKRSKSTGLVNNPADTGSLELDCRVLIYKKNFWGWYRPLTTFNFAPEHTEIYDIIVLH